MATLPTYDEMEAYAREAAAARGMDPDKFVRALKTEGLARNTWQSNVKKNGMREPSYGPMQLLVGDGKNFPRGLGNKMIDQTGIDPSDPANWRASIDFGADTVAKEGWSQWYGPKNAGLDRWYGVNKGAKPMGLTVNSTPDRLPMIDGPGDNTWNDMARANIDVRKNAGVDPANTEMVSTPAAVDRAVTPPATATLGDKIGTSLFGPDLASKLKTMSAPAIPATATAPAAPGGVLTQGLGLLSSIMAPKQAPQQSAPIQSTLPASEAGDAERAKGAAAMMAALIASKKKPPVPGQSPYGTTINSYPGFMV